MPFTDRWAVVLLSDIGELPASAERHSGNARLQQSISVTQSRRTTKRPLEKRRTVANSDLQVHRNPAKLH